MLWDAVVFVLSPIVWLMDLCLSILVTVTGSVGMSVLLLSVTTMVLTQPLRKKARVVEVRITAKSNAVNEEVRALGKDLRGEQRFLATEKLYARYSYHPILAIGQAASLFIVLPILLSAIVLFSSGTTVEGHGFLCIKDLSQPDRLLFSANVLPFIMTGITIADAHVRYREDRSARYRFYGVALLLLVLVYAMPSALVLFWTGSNLVALAGVSWASCRSEAGR